MKPSEFKISISVENYDEKTSENYRKSLSLQNIKDVNLAAQPSQQITTKKITERIYGCAYKIKFTKPK